MKARWDWEEFVIGLITFPIALAAVSFFEFYLFHYFIGWETFILGCIGMAAGRAVKWH